MASKSAKRMTAVQEDEYSIGSDDSGMGKTTIHADESQTEDSKQPLVIGEKENRLVLRSKLLVVLVLVAAAASAAAMAYLFTSRAEENEFESDVS